MQLGCCIVGETVFAEEGKGAIDVADGANVLDVEDEGGGVGAVCHCFGG